VDGEVVRRRRRSWSEDEKERIVAETFQPGASVSIVARRHDLNANLLFTWRRQAGARRPAVDGSTGTFVPAIIEAERSASGYQACAQDEDAPRRAASPPIDGRMEIVLAGGARVVVGNDVNEAALARVVGRRAGASMIPVPSGVRVWLATGRTDMRKGFDGLALLVQETLSHDPHNGNLFVFRGRRGDLIKVLWHDGQGMCLFSKRLERGRFIWPSPADGVVTITPAQLGYLLEGIDWRAPQRTWVPQAAG